MAQLQDSSFSFILCFRPNSKGKSKLFEKDSMFTQLQSAGVQHLASLNSGTSFPVHTEFKSLCQEFIEHIPPKFTVNKTNREVAKLILSLFGLEEGKDYTVGVSEIFLSSKQTALIEIAREDKQMFIERMKQGL